MEERKETFQVLPGSRNPKSVQGLRDLVRLGPGLPPPPWTCCHPDSSGPVPFTWNTPPAPLHLTHATSLALWLKRPFFKKVTSPQCPIGLGIFPLSTAVSVGNHVFNNNTIISLISLSPLEQELRGDQSLPHMFREEPQHLGCILGPST